MDQRMEKPQTPDSANVPDSAEMARQRQKEHQAIITALLATLRHFFGDFSPSVEKGL